MINIRGKEDIEGVLGTLTDEDRRAKERRAPRKERGDQQPVSRDARRARHERQREDGHEALARVAQTEEKYGHLRLGKLPLDGNAVMKALGL